VNYKLDLGTNYYQVSATCYLPPFIQGETNKKPTFICHKSPPSLPLILPSFIYYHQRIYLLKINVTTLSLLPRLLHLPRRTQQQSTYASTSINLNQDEVLCSSRRSRCRHHCSIHPRFPSLCSMFSLLLLLLHRLNCCCIHLDDNYTGCPN